MTSNDLVQAINSDTMDHMYMLLATPPMAYSTIDAARAVIESYMADVKRAYGLMGVTEKSNDNHTSIWIMPDGSWIARSCINKIKVVEEADVTKETDKLIEAVPTGDYGTN